MRELLKSLESSEGHEAVPGAEEGVVALVAQDGGGVKELDLLGPGREDLPGDGRAQEPGGLGDHVLVDGGQDVPGGLLDHAASEGGGVDVSVVVGDVDALEECSCYR